MDRNAIDWIQQALKSRGAIPEVLWVDAHTHVHQWEFPNVIREALERNDRAILNCFDLTPEEIISFRNYMEAYQKNLNSSDMHITWVRNLATTASLLCSDWAQTPHELVSMIRHQAGVRLQNSVGAKWKLTDPMGTKLTGIIQTCLRSIHRLQRVARARRRHELAGMGSAAHLACRNFWNVCI